MKTLRRLTFQLLIALSFALVSQSAFSQPQTQVVSNGNVRGPGKPVTIPVTIRTKEEVAERTEETYFQNVDLVISEDGATVTR